MQIWSWSQIEQQSTRDINKRPIRKTVVFVGLSPTLASHRFLQHLRLQETKPEYRKTCRSFLPSTPNVDEIVSSFRLGGTFPRNLSHLTRPINYMARLLAEKRQSESRVRFRHHEQPRCSTPCRNSSKRLGAQRSERYNISCSTACVHSSLLLRNSSLHESGCIIIPLCCAFSGLHRICNSTWGQGWKSKERIQYLMVWFSNSTLSFQFNALQKRKVWASRESWDQGVCVAWRVKWSFTVNVLTSRSGRKNYVPITSPRLRWAREKRVYWSRDNCLHKLWFTVVSYPYGAQNENADGKDDASGWTPTTGERHLLSFVASIMGTL